MFCEKCGSQIRDDSKFCEVCGTIIQNRVIDSSTEYNELLNELEEAKARNLESIAEENKAKEEAVLLGIKDEYEDVFAPVNNSVKTEGNSVPFHNKKNPIIVVVCIVLSILAIAFGIILALKKAGSNTNEKPSVPIEEDKDTEIINETDDNSNGWNLEIIDTRGSNYNNQWLDYPGEPTYLLEFGDTLYVDLKLSGNGVSKNETEITVEVIGKEWKDNNFVDTIDTFTLDKLQKNGSTDTFEYSMLSVSRFIGMSMKAIFYDDSGNELNHLNIQYGYPDGGDSSKYIVTAEPNLRLRNEPSADSDVIGKLFYGEIISVYKIINGWAIVGGYGAPEEIAWASAEYLTPYDEKNSVDLSMDYAVDYYDIIGMKLKDVTKNLGTGFYKNPPGPAENMPSLYYRRPNSEIWIYYYNPSIGLFPEWGAEEADKVYDITNESVIVSYSISTQGTKIFDRVSIGDNGNDLISELEKYDIGYELISDDFTMLHFIVFNVDNKSFARVACNMDSMEIKGIEVYDNQKSDFVWVE